MNRRILTALVSVGLLLAGCSSNKPRPDAPAVAETPAQSSGPTTNPVPSNRGTQGQNQNSGVATVSVDGGASGGAVAPGGALGSQRVIYFDLDSSEIRNEYIDVIAAHGRFLASNATVRVRLEGHSDERGSREYNIALAERRAQAVKRALALQGVQDSQIATVSYGEERPAAVGSDDNAWSKNRRVEIVVIN